MGGELEQQILSSGILLTNTEKPIPSFPDYLNEVKDFLDEEQTHQSLPFVNQETSFMNLIRTLSSGYPYAVLLGQSGIGKSMILEYAVEVLTGKIGLEEVAHSIPDAVPLLRNTIDKLHQFEHRNYLLLPNLKTPNEVTIIPYTDYTLVEQDLTVAGSFCQELGAFLTEFASQNRDDILMEMDSVQFERFIDANVYQLYGDLYSSLQHRIHLKSREIDADESAALHHTIPLIELQLPDEINTPYLESICSLQEQKEYQPNYGLLKQEAGFKDSRRGVTRVDIERGFAQSIIPDLTALPYQKILNDIRHIDLTDGDTLEVFKERFSHTAHELYEMIQEIGTKEQDITYNTILTQIRREQTTAVPSCTISEKTTDFLSTKIEGIYETFQEEDCTTALRNWMDSVYSYFVEDTKMLKDTMNGILSEIVDLEKKYYQKRHNRQAKEERDDDESAYGPSTESELFLEFSKIGFPITHGRFTYDALELFSIHYIDSNKDDDAGISWTKINSVKSETIFGSFNEIDTDTPPHTALDSLGSFFQSGILLFKDSFSDFISTITAEENKESGLREQFLEYLQTGKMTLIHSGATYELEAPKIILGCDNEDPFVTVLGGIFARDETGLRGRIKSLQVPHITKNTAEMRQGTIRVIYDTLQTFNERSQTTEPVSITPEATNMILQSSILSEELASLKYREFTKQIEDICAYTVSKEQLTITPDILKLKTFDEIPPYFFIRVDQEKTYGGYFSLPQKQVGHIHGLAVTKDGMGSLVKVRTGYLPPLHDTQKVFEHFNLIDIESNMTDETTIKGYDLAKHYTRALISHHAAEGKDASRLSGDWQLNTHFADSWSGIGGPSASMAIAISMVSALTEEEIYRNRFITGTIDPITGDAGQIGGTYLKGLVPMHLKAIENEDPTYSSEEHMYFLFPAQNYKDFTQNMIFDPFNLDDKVVCIPYTNFAQAYYLFTEEGALKSDSIKNSQKYGQEKINDVVLPKIQERFT